MAFFQDAVEEFKTLKPVGKILVIGVLAAAAIIGYEVYRNRVASAGGASTTPVSDNGAGVNPFTITTQTPTASTPSTNPLQTITGTIAKGVVKVTPKPPSKVTATPIHTPTLGSVSGIQPVKPIQHVVATIKAVAAKVTTPVNQNRGVPSRSSTNNYIFWKGPVGKPSTSQVSPAEWMSRAKGHPIEVNGTFTGGR